MSVTLTGGHLLQATLVECTASGSCLVSTLDVLGQVAAQPLYLVVLTTLTSVQLS